MTESLPAFIRNLLNEDNYNLENNHTCTCTIDCDEDNTEASIRKMHSRPLYIISSTTYKSLEEASEQLSEWFEDGTLNAYTAVYAFESLNERFYVISASEFDTEEEANEQMIEWHNMGMLDQNARVYKTSLADTYEISIKLTSASLL